MKALRRQKPASFARFSSFALLLSAALVACSTDLHEVRLPRRSASAADDAAAREAAFKQAAEQAAAWQREADERKHAEEREQSARELAAARQALAKVERGAAIKAAAEAERGAAIKAAAEAERGAAIKATAEKEHGAASRAAAENDVAAARAVAATGHASEAREAKTVSETDWHVVGGSRESTADKPATRSDKTRGEEPAEAVARQDVRAMQAPAPAVAPVAAPHTDDQRLRQLAADRARISPEKSYRIGAGDLLEINVFDLPEMNRKVRVATNGAIQLPLIGGVRVVGQSEADVAKQIATRLEKSYLQNPQVDVFVDEYKSQQVAVTGSVSKPGLYPLTREHYTIIDMLSEAGGLTKDAGAVVEFIPAGEAGRSTAFDLASAGGRFSPANDPGNGITIDLNELLRGGNRNALNLAVVAGDVIFVPEAGSFTIEGWIDKPGTYPITRNTTVLAALSTGGGSLFPSRLGHVEILRSNDGGGGRSVQVVDLNAVRAGETPDVELRSGDIVRVPGHLILMVPWGFYTLIKSLISIGASFPII